MREFSAAAKSQYPSLTRNFDIVEQKQAEALVINRQKIGVKDLLLKMIPCMSVNHDTSCRLPSPQSDSSAPSTRTCSSRSSSSKESAERPS